MNPANVFIVVVVVVVVLVVVVVVVLVVVDVVEGGDITVSDSFGDLAESTSSEGIAGGADASVLTWLSC